MTRRLLPGHRPRGRRVALRSAADDRYLSLAKERAGRPPARFLSVVGDWIVARDDAGKSVIQVDGRHWIKGQPSAGLAAKARTIYGAKHEEFIDSVKAPHEDRRGRHPAPRLLDDELLLEFTLPEAVSGKVGLWSKTDSVSQFDDYTVVAR